MSLFKKIQKNFKKTLLRAVLVLSLAVGTGQATEATKFHTVEISKFLTEMKVSAKKLDNEKFTNNLLALQEALKLEHSETKDGVSDVSYSFETFINNIIKFTDEIPYFESKLQEDPETIIRSSKKLFELAGEVMFSLVYFEKDLSRLEQHENLTKEINVLNKTLSKNLLESLELIQKKIDEKTLTELEKFALSVDKNFKTISEYENNFHHLFPASITNFTKALINIYKYLPEEKSRVKKTTKKWEKHLSKEIEKHIDFMQTTIVSLEKNPDKSKFALKLLKTKKEQLKDIENLKSLL